MAQDSGIDRRAFLRNAGGTALLGAVGVKPAIAAGLTEGPSTPGSQVFDFDEIYSRVGTDCTKWDGAIATYGQGIEVGMGIADLDFRTAPSITRALAERSEHENWGYLRRPARYVDAVVDWNRRRYGLDIDPETVVWTTGVHPGLIAALQTFAPPGAKVPPDDADVQRLLQRPALHEDRGRGQSHEVGRWEVCDRLRGLRAAGDSRQCFHSL